LPTREEELANPDHAKNVYAGAYSRLASYVKHQKRFPSVASAWSVYLHMRNCCAIRRFAIPFAFAVPLLLLFNIQITSWHAFISMPRRMDYAFGFALLMDLIWLFFFTKHRVREAEFTYGREILSVCDCLDPPKVLETLHSS
jgi:hypothetical protein